MRQRHGYPCDERLGSPGTDTAAHNDGGDSERLIFFLPVKVVGNEVNASPALVTRSTLLPRSYSNGATDTSLCLLL